VGRPQTRHASKPDADIYEDREVEVLSQVAISIDEQIAAIEDAVRARRAA
jgi:hypothetical protein